MGKPRPRIYYQWVLNLDAEGLALCVENLLAQLANFEGRQLAAYGLTSLPLVGARVLAGGGRYSGLAIRKEREGHGTRRQVEGSGDRSRPVVIVDDCIASGQSLFRAIEALEARGRCGARQPSLGGRRRMGRRLGLQGFHRIRCLARP